MKENLTKKLMLIGGACLLVTGAFAQNDPAVPLPPGYGARGQTPSQKPGYPPGHGWRGGFIEDGIVEEQGNLNPEAAVKIYDSAIQKYDKEKMKAGRAMLAAAEAHRKLGHSKKADEYLDRLQKEFPDLAEKYKRDTAAHYTDLDPVAIAEEDVKNKELKREAGRATTAEVNNARIQALEIARQYSTNPQQKKEILAKELELAKEILTGYETLLSGGRILEQGQEISEARMRVAELTRALRDDSRKMADERKAKSKLQKLDTLTPPEKPELPERTERTERPEVIDQAQIEKALSAVDQAMKTQDAARGIDLKPVFDIVNKTLRDLDVQLSRDLKIAAEDRASKTQRMAKMQSEDRSQIVREREEQAKAEMDNARQQLREAQKQMQSLVVMKESLGGPVEALPKPISEDPRYKELKKSYESLVLSMADTSANVASNAVPLVVEKMKIWVDKIFLPELQSALQKAEREMKLAREEVQRSNEELQKTRDVEKRLQMDQQNSSGKP